MLKRYSIFSLPLLCSLQLGASLNPLGQDITITSTLRTQERILGQVNLTIGAQGELSIASSDISFALNKILPEKILFQLNEQAQDNKITDSMLKDLGFPISLDPQTFELLIEVPIDQNRINAISLAPLKNQTQFQKPSIFNGYVNAFLSASRDSSSNHENRYSQSHRLKAGINIDAANVTYEAEFLDSNKTEAEFNRTFTQISYDIPEQGTRLLVGDIVTPKSTFQSGTDIAGLGIVRNFGNIPTRNLHSTGSQQFTLRQASDIDVLIDGIVIQRIKLPAGRYDLNDIPLARGNNNVELLIRDQAGNEEKISFSIAIDNNLIKEGEFEFALTSGAPASFEQGKLNYDDANLLSTGLLEYGLSPSWTIGVNGQHYDKNYQFGFLSLNAWSFGTTEFIFNHSQHKDNGAGNVFRFAYATPQEFQDLLNFQFNALYEYFSPNFSQVDALPSDLQSMIQHNFKLSASSNISENYNAGLNINIQKGYESDENSWSLGTTLSGPIADTDATFGVHFRYLTDFQDEKEFDLTATVSYPFKLNHQFVTQYRNSGSELQFDYRYRNPSDVVGKTNANLNLVTNERDPIVVNGDINYTANRFNLGLEQDTRAQSLTSKDLTTSTKVTLDTAIAFSGTKVAIGRPVGNSFAVVSPNNNLSNHPIKLLPNDDGSAHVISNKSRNVLISNMSAYSEQTIDYEVKDLPAGYDLGAGVFAVNPMQGQAYQFEIGTDAAHTLMGSLVDKANNQPISLAAGIAYKKSDPKIQVEFFSTKRGRIAITGMSPGDWILKLNTQPEKTVEITLIENANMLDNKGKIYVD